MLQNNELSINPVGNGTAHPKQDRRNLSHRAVLAICLGGLQFIAVLSVVLSTYVSSERALLRQAEDSMRIASESIESQVRNFLDPARNTLNAARGLAENGLLDISDDAALERHFFQQLQVAPQLAGVFLADETGRFVYVMRSEEEGVFRSKFIPGFALGDETHAASFTWRDSNFGIVNRAFDPNDRYEARTRPWYVSVAENSVPTWTNPYIYFSARKPGITYAVPVLAADGRQRAILGIDIQIEAISDFLGHLWSKNRGAALVLNKKGEVIAHPELDLIRDDADLDHPELVHVDQIDDVISKAAFGRVAEIASETGSEPTYSSFEFDGENYVSSLVEIVDPDIRWLIAIHASIDSFVGEIKLDRTRGIWIALAIAVLTSAIGFAIADRINRPLRKFATQTRMAARGEMSPDEALQTPYLELESTGETFAEEIKRRRRFEAAYGRTFELASRGMAQLDPFNGQLKRTNVQLSKILGFEEGELRQTTLGMLLADPKNSVVAEALGAVLKDHEYIEEAQFICQNGELVWLRMNGFLVRDGIGKPDHVLMIFDDIQEAKLNEEITADLRREMSHVARVNLMGEMASGMAHELNQPLSAISYNVDAAQSLLNSSSYSQDLKEVLSDIDRQSKRAGDIIHALRRMVRKDHGNMTSFDLLQLIHQARTLVEAEAAQSHIRISVSADIKARPVGNRTQIAQVLVNLLKNSIDAITASDRKDGSIAIKCSEGDKQIQIDVIDNGHGIAPDAKLFQPFNSLKPEGMGLGLSICRTIVEQHGGKIWYEEARKTGARISFTLPAQSEDDVEIP